MYDRRLDAVVAAAELGSFSRAAARLSVSTPALVKQVSGFEAEYGVRVFERSHAGVRLTAAGGVLVEDVRAIMRQCEDSLRRARGAQEAGDAVRMGVSLMSPGRFTLDRWPQMSAMEPDLRLELVPVGSLYDERHAHGDMDRLREVLLANEGVHVVDVEAFDIELFNDSMEKGDCVLTTGAWSGVHPGFVGVPVRWTPAPCYLAYPLEPKPQVRRFVDALARCVG